MIVTGDRDAFQLIDPESRVQVMATARGITETKIYDHQAVIDRYGIAPELIPDFYGLKGDTSDNIPGVPGIGDKTAAELLQRFGSLEEVLAHIDEISGAKRKENLRRARRGRARLQAARDVQRDVAGRGRPGGRGRARARPLAPARGLPRVRAARPAARAWRRRSATTTARRRAPDDEVTAQARVRAGSPADAARLGDGEARRRRGARARDSRGRAVRARAAAGASRVACGGEVVVAGDCDGPEELVAALGERPVVAHDAKALGVVPPRLAHDTLLGAYLLEPARRGFPFARALRGARPGDRRSTTRSAADAVLLQALADWQREQIAERGLEALMADVELPLVRVLRDMEIAGVRLNLERLARDRRRACARRSTALEREIWDLAGEEFVIGSPQQLGAILFEKLGLSRKRRGKTGFSTDARVLQAIRDEHEIIPKIERWRELNQLTKTYLDVLPALADEREPHPHDVRAGGRHDRPAGVDEPEHAERPGPHPARPRDPRLLRGRARATC